MASLFRNSSATLRTYDNIATNNTIVENGDSIKIDASGFTKKCTTNDRIDGASLTRESYSATNQTVEKAKIVYFRSLREGDTFKVATTATATQAAVGKYFQMDATQQVDMATVSATTGVYFVISVFPAGNYVEVEITNQGS
jgi:hypothetical protein